MPSSQWNPLCLYNSYRVIRPCILQGLSCQWALLLQSLPLHFLRFFCSSSLIQEAVNRVHRQFILASHLMIAMATVGWGNFWINASIVHLLAFPRLRGGSCFYLAQRMKGRPRAAESGRRFSTFCLDGQIPQALQGGGAGSQVRQPTPPELLYPHTMAMIMS